MCIIVDMAEFISSFITGFQDVVAKDLPARLPGCTILNLFDGLIHYKYAGNSRDLEKIFYFNNTFFVLKTMKGKGLNFPSLVGAVASEKKYYLINKGTFRVRFQNENQFAKVDKNISKKAEECVLRNSKLQIDRLSPDTEIWYSIRREGFAFCGQLISKREFTEKNLNKGELRPEIAYFMCCFADFEKQKIVADPFCGYGSVSIQLSKRFNCEKIFVSDIDGEKIDLLKKNKHLQRDYINILCENAFELNDVSDKYFDVIITDPPWGFYEDIGDIFEFYKKMFVSFRRVLKDDGMMVILSARVEEIKKAMDEMNVQIIDSLHTLVNGKKASLFKCSFV